MASLLGTGKKVIRIPRPKGQSSNTSATTSASGLGLTALVADDTAHGWTVAPTESEDVARSEVTDVTFDEPNS
ncbi:hypothetical protein VB773_17455 [Haloarculaceae archaeon H-GB2-1]|nr:hypothetical protein [Haloarculaceae archaeon H-GB2-1]